MCDASVDAALRIDTIQYLLSSINELRQSSGAGLKQFGLDQIKCANIAPTIPSAPAPNAGYLWQDSTIGKAGSIVLSTSTTRSVQEAERHLKHELIHAYDAARGNLDPSDCFQQACSEIRAARLSGDCTVSREAKSGNLSIMNSGIGCVNQRAMLAVSNNPMCKAISDRAVEKMMPVCYQDYSPFVAPLYVEGDFHPKK